MSTQPLSYPLEQSPQSSAIAWGGLIAGVLDAVDGCVAYGLLGMSPIRVLQLIASGILGPGSFNEVVLRAS